jgi:hypothetical protein
MAHDRAVLLREAGEVERRASLAFEMRRHSEQGADGDDAGAADAGDEDVVGLLQRPRRRDRQIAEQIVDGERRLDRPFRPAAVHGDKARAKTFDAGEILVAIGLVDLALAAELRLQRLH